MGMKRHHVRRAHARMRSLVLRQVDQLRRLAHSANGGFLNRLPLSDQGDHAAVMVGVHLAIEQINAVHLHGVDDGIHLRLIAAFGKIGNTLNQS